MELPCRDLVPRSRDLRRLGIAILSLCALAPRPAAGELGPWEPVGPDGADLLGECLLAPPTGRSQLFVGTSGGLFVSPHPGGDWSPVPPIGSSNVVDLAADGPARRLYAATGLGLLVSEDDGATWRDVSPEVSPALVTVDPLDDATLVAWGPVLGFSHSTDGGASWTQGGYTENDCFTALAAHPTAAETYFGTSRCCVGDDEPCGGVFVTVDAWETRQRVRGRDGFDIAFAPPETLFVADFDGVWRSLDAGATWELVSGEVPVYIAGAVLVDPTDPDVVYAGVHPNPLAEPGAAKVIVSRDGGDHWSRMDDGLPEDSIVDLAIDPRRPQFVYAATRNHGVYRRQRFAVPPVPDPPPGPWITSGAVPGFQVKARISTAAGGELPSGQEAACIPETLCLSGSVPGRPEVFVRVVGPKPNGRLWPTLVKFSTSTVEVWIEQLESGVVRYYRLEGATPGVDELPGLFDRIGFLP